jgi:hypothetical protein
MKDEGKRAWFRSIVQEGSKPEGGVNALHRNLHRNGIPLLPRCQPGRKEMKRGRRASPQSGPEARNRGEAS